MLVSRRGRSLRVSGKLRSWAPKVLMCPAMGGLGRLLSYWDESKLSFDSFILLYDKGTSWDFLILLTFFSSVPKSGKRISMLSSICRDKGLAHQDSWRLAPYSITELVCREVHLDLPCCMCEASRHWG